MAVCSSAGGGSALADVGYWPGSLAAPGWVRGGLGCLGFWGSPPPGWGSGWALSPGWCVARLVGGCVHGGPALVRGGFWCIDGTMGRLMLCGAWWFGYCGPCLDRSPSFGGFQGTRVPTAVSGELASGKMCRVPQTY